MRTMLLVVMLIVVGGCGKETQYAPVPQRTTYEISLNCANCGRSMSTDQTLGESKADRIKELRRDHPKCYDCKCDFFEPEQTGQSN